MSILSQDRHKKYRCSECGKEDRHGRLVGHVLKHHVPFDRAPYYCSLCSFRCVQKKELAEHLTKYKRHGEELARRPQAELSDILHFSANPAKVEDFIVAITAKESPKPKKDVDHQGQLALPDWLSEVPIVTSDQTNFSTLDLVQLIGAGSDLWLSPVLSDATATSATPEVVKEFTATSEIKGIMGTYVASKGVVRVPALEPTGEEDPLLGTIEGMATPLRDEPAEDVFLQIMAGPPAVIETEGEEVSHARDQPPVMCLCPQLVEALTALTSSNKEVLKELKAHTNELRRMSKTVTYLWDEVKDVRRNVASLENARWTALKRNRSPLKSVVCMPPKRQKKSNKDKENK